MLPLGDILCLSTCIRLCTMVCPTVCMSVRLCGDGCRRCRQKTPMSRLTTVGRVQTARCASADQQVITHTDPARQWVHLLLCCASGVAVVSTADSVSVNRTRLRTVRMGREAVARLLHICSRDQNTNTGTGSIGTDSGECTSEGTIAEAQSPRHHRRTNTTPHYYVLRTALADPHFLPLVRRHVPSRRSLHPSLHSPALSSAKACATLFRSFPANSVHRVTFSGILSGLAL